jgi:hypothetical protein
MDCLKLGYSKLKLIQSKRPDLGGGLPELHSDPELRSFLSYVSKNGLREQAVWAVNRVRHARRVRQARLQNTP